jgi:hypothetical protein
MIESHPNLGQLNLGSTIPYLKKPQMTSMILKTDVFKNKTLYQNLYSCLENVTSVCVKWNVASCKVPHNSFT